MFLLLHFTGLDVFTCKCFFHLFVDSHHLVSGENEGVIVTPSFASIQGQDGDGPVPLDLDRVPLAVVDENCGKPNLLLFGS